MAMFGRHAARLAAGGIEAVVLALRTHPDVGAEQIAGCAALRNLARDPRTYKAVHDRRARHTDTYQ